MSDFFPIAFHHNPDCGTSRNALEIVRAAGYAPEVILYRDVGWTRPHLLSLFAAMGVRPKDVLRESKVPEEALAMAHAARTDDEMIAAMIAHPILVNRPIVATPKGVALCRPSEKVLDLLDRYPPGPFAKEDGELIIDADGNRVA